VKRRLGAVAWLLDRGADVNRRATFGGPSHGDGVTALHLAAQNGDVDAVRFLLDRGADRRIVDAIYQSTPLGWATHFERTEVADLLGG
jgi:ankyrin repeat protein